MTVTATETAREAVSKIDDFEQQIRSLITRDNAPTGMKSLSARAEETRDKLLELSGAGIELELSDDLRQQSATYVLAAARDLTRFVKATDDDARLGFATDALIELEAVRHILRDGIDHEPIRTETEDGAVLLTRRDAIDHVERWLPRLTRDEQAEILGLDAREISRWKNQTAENPASRRAEMAIELVGILRHSWTNEGVARWFKREHPALNGKAPVDVIDEPDWERRIIDAARAGRAQMAT